MVIYTYLYLSNSIKANRLLLTINQKSMKRIFKRINYYLSEKYVNTFNYQPYLHTILLHKMYNSREDVTPLNGDVAEGVDKFQFETFIKYFADRNVKFIDESDIIENKLDPKKQYIYLTFDDGYYNNFICLDILKKYNAKATFFISTDHIKKGKAYWWDSLVQELTKRNRTSEIDETIKKMYQMKWPEQDKFMADSFGQEALIPKNDIDRPMTKSELKEFADHENTTIGNHTHSHLNITIYEDKEVSDSIKSAEDFLREITSQKITSISYPYGFINEAKVALVKKLNYKIGITVVPGINNVSELHKDNNTLLLKRSQLSGFFDITSQCHNLHTNNFSIAAKIKSLLK